MTVHVDTTGEAADWPKVLVDSATAVGLTLPALTADVPVTWKVLSASEPGLVTFDRVGPPYTGVLDHTLASQLGYTTGHEDETTASGDPVTGTVIVAVTVRRTGIDELRTLITAFVTGQIPDVAAPVVSDPVASIVNPILASYLELIFQHLDDVTAIDGTAQLHVTHHTPPVTTTQPACRTTNGAILAGTFTGDLAGSFEIVENGLAGHTDETYTGHIELTSNASTVTGTINMHWSGAGDITIGNATSHVTEDSTLTDATISGPASKPVVDGTLAGQITIDGTPTPLPASHPAHIPLHITNTNCQTITGDAIALLRDLLPPSPDTLTGNGTWTASIPWATVRGLPRQGLASPLPGIERER